MLGPEQDGLLSRTATQGDSGWICVEEIWDLDHPRCPVAKLGRKRFSEPSKYLHYRFLTTAQFVEYFGVLAAPAKSRNN